MYSLPGKKIGIGAGRMGMTQSVQANGEASSMWLYGAIEAPVSITRYGFGHRSRVTGCQQPGLPSGPPCAFTRGRLSG